MSDEMETRQVAETSQQAVQNDADVGRNDTHMGRNDVEVPEDNMETTQSQQQSQYQHEQSQNVITNVATQRTTPSQNEGAPGFTDEEFREFWSENYGVYMSDINPDAIDPELPESYDFYGAEPYDFYGTEPVFNVICELCKNFITERGMRVNLVSDSSVCLYSTDIPTEVMRVTERKKVIPSCECEAYEVECCHVVSCGGKEMSGSCGGDCGKGITSSGVISMEEEKEDIGASSDVLSTQGKTKDGETPGASATCGATCGAVIGYHVLKPCEVCSMAEHNGHFWLLDQGVCGKERFWCGEGVEESAEAEEVGGTGAVDEAAEAGEGDQDIGNTVGKNTKRIMKWSELSYNGEKVVSTSVDEIDISLANPIDPTQRTDVAEEHEHSSSQQRGQQENDSSSYTGIEREHDSCQPIQIEQGIEQRADSNSEDSSTTVCPVCMSSPVYKPTRVKKCGHIFCFGCISREVDMRRKCPLDRIAIEREDLERIEIGEGVGVGGVLDHGSEDSLEHGLEKRRSGNHFQGARGKEQTDSGGQKDLGKSMEREREIGGG